MLIVQAIDLLSLCLFRFDTGQKVFYLTVKTELKVDQPSDLSYIYLYVYLYK